MVAGGRLDLQVSNTTCCSAQQLAQRFNLSTEAPAEGHSARSAGIELGGRGGLTSPSPIDCMPPDMPLDLSETRFPKHQGALSKRSLVFIYIRRPQP